MKEVGQSLPLVLQFKKRTKKLKMEAREEDEDELLIQPGGMVEELERGDDEDERKTLTDATTLSMACFVCVSLAAFLGDASRGLVVPSLVPYITEAGGDATFVGWTNGLYSIGRLIAAPLFGWWSERRAYREAIMVNLAIFLIGNLMYALAEHSKWTILMSRLIVGLGSGTLGLSRGYVAQTTSKRDRAQYMAWLVASQFIGYSVTPGIGALLSLVDLPLFGSYRINQFTSAGYLMVWCGLFNLIMLSVVWKEPPPLPDQPSNSDTSGEGKQNSILAILFGPVALFVALQFLSRCVVAIYETMSQLIAIGIFDWSILLFGAISCFFGVVGTGVLFLQKPLVRALQEEWVLIIGLCALSVGLFVFPPADFLYHHDVLVIQYSVGSVLIFGVGYPISQALLLSLFSKALGPTPQSTIMGMMASLGSAARVIGALIAGWCYQTGWIGTCFYIPGLLILISTAGTAVFFRRGRRMIDSTKPYR